MFDSDNEVPEEILLEYEKLLKKSQAENFDELYNTDLLKIIGKDGYGSHIVLLIPCFIISSGSDPEKTLRYVIMTLDPIVKENYVLVLCETHTNWLSNMVYAYAKQWYDTLPRIYKKNLKKLYLVHSGFFSKSLLTILTPFVSTKFWKKVEYIEKLEDLFLKLNINPTENLKHFPYIVQRNEEVLLAEGIPISPFSADLEILCQRFGKSYNGFKHIPSILVDFLTYLCKPETITTKDLFYLQTDANTIYNIIGDIEYGEPTTDFSNIPSLVCSFRLFLDTQKHGLLGKDAFTRLYHLKTVSASNKTIKENIKKLYNKLKPGTRDCILCILQFFQTVSKYSNENNMTIETLGKIFAPTFFRPKKTHFLFVECIPMANKCMQLLIENPEFLTVQDTNNADSSSDSSESTDHDTNSDKSENSESNESSDEEEDKSKSIESNKTLESEHSNSAENLNKKNVNELDSKKKPEAESEESEEESEESEDESKESDDDSKESEDESDESEEEEKKEKGNVKEQESIASETKKVVFKRENETIE
ncbi:rhoGAP GTPase, putative [Plasmodium chabaudi chabaudi]|uniref:Rho GTPase-activating protein, putative n=2 Tax=Plasmodium chabaudi TaxID=5825 RepID=A0A077TMG9_PLACU|nr:rho GTPase-activating protein, putative [Plasmodium chabaudi chabaudi]SCM22970.1 rhoGAP GTPase, putative [Plasmodium chabaudi adami]SCM24317.1 rhoGAP GTPase, putative [Plasmodium chabaudi chabaudi]SCN61771.1 rhoGAP GTPase, putative [Plasmodium chabaudi chabaudi]VTZ69532.1 rho GTPase-activating protein, putative [Plasmodium chabaudi chabaudi]|eukprot:XP_016654171.1 rhoGAP GTPase, putative [Plasmodium chabaudi chabaudi]